MPLAVLRIRPARIINLAETISASLGASFKVPDRPQEGAVLLPDAQGAVIRQFCQDGSGSMWMRLNQRGLLMVDGQTIVHYTNSPDNPASLSANMVNDLMCDGNGNIWIATQKGIDRFDSETESFTHCDVDDFNAYIMRFILDQKGRLYAQSRRAMLLYNPDTDIFERILDFPTLTSREPLPLLDPIGRLWIRFDEQIVRFDSEFHADLQIPCTNQVRSLFPDGANSILILEGTKLRALDITSGAVGSLPAALNALEGIPVESSYRHLPTVVSTAVPLRSEHPQRPLQ